MGLDVVELLITVEERFGISIRDDELAQVKTVGDLQVCVLTALRETSAGSAA